AMLAKLERELPHATLADRARFLRAYAGSDCSAARACWRDVAAAVRALAARDAARLARMARPRGRRFASFAAHGWRGLRDAGVRAEELERLPQAAAEALDLDRAVKAGELDAHLARVRAAQYASGAGVVVEATAGTHFAVAVRARRAGARRAFALALVLHRRGLAPRPVALLRRRGDALLVLEGRSPAVFEGRSPNPLDEPGIARQRAALPAVTGLVVRLLALGALRAAPPPQLVARTAPGPVGAALLAPWLLEPGRGTGLPDRRLGRRLAQRILGLAQDGRSDPLRAAPGAPAGTEGALPDR
ncbi:MAG TPA: hypothetical protein VHQ66_14550, partial [Myxococcota bacterium]|nr:hypothetical protein [Myxococcota bacterium]